MVFNAFKLADVLHYGTYLNFYEPLFFAVMSKDKYNSLPADLQKIIDDSIAWGTQDAIQTLGSLQGIGIEYAKSKNFEFTTLSPEELSKWRDMITPVQQGWAKDLDSRGLPGTQLMQFQQERLAFYESQ